MLCTERIDDLQYLDVRINSYQCTCKSVTRFLLDEEPVTAGLEVLEQSEVLAQTSSSRDDCLDSGLSSLTHCACDTRNWLLFHAHIFVHAWNRDIAEA